MEDVSPLYSAIANFWFFGGEKNYKAVLKIALKKIGH